MIEDQKGKILAALAESIDISDANYQAAESKYQYLGEWLSDQSKSKIARYKPHVFSQGSFRLGTATKPWKRDDYDLDLACKLQEGITATTHTQADLKQMVGADLETYRNERKMQQKLEEKHRCWRLKSEERLKFHLDTVPCIRHTDSVWKAIQQRMIQAGMSNLFAQDLAQLAVAITDDRHPLYRRISEDWQISNPEGYARWFESRMRLADSLLKARALQANVARVDDLPAYRWKTPLQMAIQILKRHRDLMFEKAPERKPISIIITTLAAVAYRGEFELLAALEQILSNMSVGTSRPRVPNPVNPVEDFADQWGTQEGRQLCLEDNFIVWLEKAKSDIYKVTSITDRSSLQDHATKLFGVTLSDDVLTSIIGSGPRVSSSPAVHVIRNAPKPWCR